MKRTDCLTVALMLASLTAIGCDDTAAAVDERSEKEYDELKQEIDQLNTRLENVEEKAEREMKQLEEQIKQSGRDVENAAEEVGRDLKQGVDHADKEIAGEIRDDDS